MTEPPTLLAPYLASLRRCIMKGGEAWESLGEKAPELRLPMGSRARAAFIYDQIAYAARAEFSLYHPHVKIRDDHGFLILQIDQGNACCLIRFKKLDSRGRARQILTRQQQQWFSLQLRFANMPEAERFIAGYKLDPFHLGIEEALITKQDRYHVLWSIALPEAAQPEPNLVVPIRSVPPKPPQQPEVVSTLIPKDEVKSPESED